MSKLGILGATALSLTLAIATPALAQMGRGGGGGGPHVGGGGGGGVHVGGGGGIGGVQIERDLVDIRLAQKVAAQIADVGDFGEHALRQLALYAQAELCRPRIRVVHVLIRQTGSVAARTRRSHPRSWPFSICHHSA